MAPGVGEEEDIMSASPPSQTPMAPWEQLRHRALVEAAVRQPLSCLGLRENRVGEAAQGSLPWSKLLLLGPFPLLGGSWVGREWGRGTVLAKNESASKPDQRLNLALAAAVCPTTVPPPSLPSPLFPPQLLRNLACAQFVEERTHPL